MNKMKKFLVLLLVLGIALTGCAKDNAPETVDPDREPKAEQPEEVEEVEVAEKVEMVTFTGEITANVAPYFVVIESEYNPLVFNGKEYTRIALGEDKISKYVDRDCFSYHLEGFPMLDTYGKYVDVTIEFNPADASDDERGFLYVSDYNVIPTRDEELVDKSGEDYPISYYQDVILTLCVGMYGNDADNIKDNPGYGFDDFKEAVDKIEEKGYTFKKENGYYKVVNENAYNFDHIPTVDEMCKLLDIDKSQIKKVQDGGYFMYSSSYSNDEISFVAFHDEEELKGTQKVDMLTIRGYNYTAYGVSLSDSVNKAFEKISKNYKGMYSHHDDSTAKYVYDVDGWGFTVNSIGYDNDHEVDEYDLVKWISVYAIID
jgi:hypothetical protein